MKQTLTEQEIRQRLKKDGFIHFLTVATGTVITPSAADFLRENSISLVFSETETLKKEISVSEYGEKKQLYYGPGGEELDHKPEDLTHLHGNQLTEKDHPVIAFRGKLDSLTANIVEAQLLGEEKNNSAYINDLNEILIFIRSLLPAEYNNQPLPEFHLLGLSSRDLRERSHNPKKYFGRRHLLVDYRMGALAIRMNTLRTLTRDLELTAVRAFKDNPRLDIIEALNRLSSLFYILMYKYLPKDYQDAGSAGI
jgi:ethanolamine utilization cobalamin adenosyltransferase